MLLPPASPNSDARDSHLDRIRTLNTRLVQYQTFNLKVWVSTPCLGVVEVQSPHQLCLLWGMIQVFHLLSLNMLETDFAEQIFGDRTENDRERKREIT